MSTLNTTNLGFFGGVAVGLGLASVTLLTTGAVRRARARRASSRPASEAACVTEEIDIVRRARGQIETSAEPRTSEADPSSFPIPVPAPSESRLESEADDYSMHDQRW